jgi:adenylate cyclase
MAHGFLATVYLLEKQLARALVEAERAIALDPNDADGYVTLARILIGSGKIEEAIGALEKAQRLNHRLPAILLAELGGAYYLMGQHDKALAALQQGVPFNPNFLPLHESLAIVYSELGRVEEANAEVAEVLRLSPKYSLEGVRQRLSYKDPAQAQRYLAALGKAGLK